MASTIHSQPHRNVWQFENEWQTGLCGCCGNTGNCLCAFLCTPCFLCRLSNRVAECPLIWCLPGSVTAMRTKIRTGFRIRGGVCSDACTTCCCPCCSLVQMYEQLESYDL